ncbi:MAG: DUF4199 domain-containing protein [Bacteroidales bacterium]|nr:DUF4199 domain-containing protein [Bacteroidales bacterium]
METREYPIWKHALNIGIITGLGLVFFSLLLFVLDLSTNKIVAYVGYLILFAGITLSSLQYRNKWAGGFISYGRSLSTGFMAGLFASIIAGIYTYFFFTYLGQGVIEEMMRAAEENLLARSPDLTDEELDIAMNITGRFMNPLWMSVMGFLAYAFFSLVFALIVSIFIKKEPQITTS